MSNLLDDLGTVFALLLGTACGFLAAYVALKLFLTFV